MRKLIFTLLFSIILFSEYRTIYQIQGQSSSSPYVNQVVTTSGVVTAKGSSGFFIQEKNPSPAWRGIYVYTASTPSVLIGDSVVITDSVKEYFGLTEIKSTSHNYSIILNTTPPSPILLPTGSVANEQWECVLVKVQNAKCTNPNAGSGEWIVNDGSGNIRIGTLLYSYSPILNRNYNITGPVYYSASNFKIVPRGSLDIKGYPIVKNVIRYPGAVTFLDNVILKAQIIDDAQIIADSLIYKINSNSWNRKTHDSINGNFYYYSIPKRNLNDTVFYYVIGKNDSFLKDSSRIYTYIVRDSINIQFKVMTYNILNFPGNTPSRLGYMMKTFRELVPDVIIVQELQNEAGANLILDSLNTINNDYARSEFIQDPNDPSSNNMLFYRMSIGSLISQDTICTSLRNINEYVMEINKNIIRFYSCHLKAGNEASSINQRLQEVTKLRNHLNTTPDSSEFIIVGDMNFYTATEPGYQKFIANEVNNRGRSRDLLGIAANWHDNPSCAPYHTQSTRTENIGDGGSIGGLDDRFDFIFANYYLNDNRGIEYIQNTYKAYGNDGNHFNLSIITGTNDSVPQEIAEALYYTSDHLPVIANFISIIFTGIEQEEKKGSIYVEIIPNGLKIRGEIGDKIQIYDILGRLKEEFHIYNCDEKILMMKTGIYFLRSFKSKIIKKVVVF